MPKRTFDAIRFCLLRRRLPPLAHPQLVHIDVVKVDIYGPHATDDCRCARPERSQDEPGYDE